MAEKIDPRTNQAPRHGGLLECFYRIEYLEKQVKELQAAIKELQVTLIPQSDD